MATLLFSILGLAVGSFVNAAAYRLSPAPTVRGGANGSKLSLVSGRSICPNCKQILPWWQLVPILSFLFLRGRCYYCQKPVSWQYPLVELLSAVAFALFIYFNPNLIHAPLRLILLVVAISVLIFIALYDFKEYLILDYAVLIGAAAALVISILQQSFLIDAVSGLALAGIFGGIYLFSKGSWIGLGDVKLAVFIGFLNGPFTLLTLALASWLGTIIGLSMIFAGQANLKTKIPFGTLLGVSAIAILIWQSHLEIFLNQFLF